MFPNASLNYSSSRVQEKKMTTVLDLLKEQGIEEGIEKGLQKSIEKLLSKGILSPREIASALEVDLAWVEEIARKMPRQGSRIR